MVSYAYIIQFFVILLCMTPSRSEIQSPACTLNFTDVFDEFQYFQDGDVIIGGVLTVRSSGNNADTPEEKTYTSSTRPLISLLSFLFAIENINQDPDILPNITLGFHLYDSWLEPRKAVWGVLKILSGLEKEIPNYSCTEHDKLAGVIGDQFSATTIPIAQILGLYRYTQISYGSTDESLSDRRLYPHVFRTVQNDHVYYLAITKLVKHFGWNWVGILLSDDDTGEKEAEILKKLLTSREICVAFEKRMTQLESRCSEVCLPGNRIKLGSSIHSCCYDCVPCSEGEISNQTDSENCMKCRDDEWPNEKKDRCILKLQEFLSYTDVLSEVFITASTLLCIVTLLVMGIFVSYLNTPVVKANNRNLSFVLLVSIMLSFLCVFLFLGQPLDITCILRVMTFGVIFSIAVSSLLAKTIIVYIAFKATKPGSYWRKWIGSKLSNSIVSLCSSVQVIICLVWLSSSRPFKEMDTQSYQDKIVIQCNEGSVIGFYSVLGYMGFLAAVSFFLAFVARTLPDSFNEAKYITFSMLVFCSAWIAMIPAYLSTKGKYMVAVEVFAILASSAGLLSCIFFPKCFIILFKPKLNTQSSLLERNKIYD
ncbi:PREDICTED: vomeronasal type-2 receptor 26-like [Nanorana parkeri]|uniref:vomeronasal type-2 receptor 26-like n=1 Tax=Nanorana parkeri TaxID=125878 RepID=UPI0008544F32|nr:PREDICTED: vomeronasal type-2 receptor 26-like [Nanorana parkeri]